MSESNTPTGETAPVAETAPVVVPVTEAAAPVETPTPTGDQPTQEPAAAPVETKPDASREAEAISDATPAAPSYTDFALPEGFSVAPEAMTKAKETFTRMGLDQDKAQELVSLHTEAIKQAVEAAFANATTYWNDQSTKWVAETRKQFGNGFDTAIGLARGVWTEVLPNQADRDSLFQVFADTKVGDNPILAKAMAEVGKRMSQVLEATGTTTWAAAMKKIREPGAPPPGNPARAPGSGRAADRRYGGRT